MGQSLIIVANVPALHGGKVNVRIGDFFLARMMATEPHALKVYLSQYTLTYEPSYDKQQLLKDLKQLENKRLFDWIGILKNKIDIIAFATDKTINTRYYNLTYRSNFRGINYFIGVDRSMKSGFVRLTIFSNFFRQFPIKDVQIDAESFSKLFTPYYSQPPEKNRLRECILTGADLMNDIKKEITKILTTYEFNQFLISSGTTDIYRQFNKQLPTQKKLMLCCHKDYKKLITDTLQNGSNRIVYEIRNNVYIHNGLSYQELTNNVVVIYPTIKFLYDSLYYNKPFEDYIWELSKNTKNDAIYQSIGTCEMGYHWFKGKQIQGDIFDDYFKYIQYYKKDKHDEYFSSDGTLRVGPNKGL